MPTSKNNGFVNPKTESKSKILIDCYNKKSNIPSTIMLLMEDIWKLTHDLNIHNCHHIYRKTNRIAYCLAKKKICSIESIFLELLQSLNLKIIMIYLSIEFIDTIICSLFIQKIKCL